MQGTSPAHAGSGRIGGRPPLGRYHFSSADCRLPSFMRRPPMTRLVRLSMLTAAATVLLIVLGGVTRSNASGAGCGNDWPLCDGRPYPSLDGLAIVEYLHRASAVLVALLVVATALLAWLTIGVSARTKLAASAATGLIVLQGALGAADSRS